MKLEKQILWKGKTEITPNFWGLKSEGGKLYVDTLSRTISYDRISPIALILFTPIFVLVFGMLSAALGLLAGIVSIVFLIYWLIIREIKYYQLVKSTVYEINPSEITIAYEFLNKKTEITIPFEQISGLHLLRYFEGAEQKVSIFIYLHEKVKTYDLLKREKSHQVKIEMISEYQKVYDLLEELQKKTTKQ